MEEVDFVEEVDHFIFSGIVEGGDVVTLFNLLRSYQGGLIDAEEMQREMDSFDAEFYRKMMQNQSYEC